MQSTRFSGAYSYYVHDPKKWMKPVVVLSAQNCFPGNMILKDARVDLPDTLLAGIEEDMKAAKGKSVDEKTVLHWVTESRELLYEYFDTLIRETLDQPWKKLTTYDDKPADDSKMALIRAWAEETRRLFDDGGVSAIHRMNPETQDHEVMFIGEPQEATKKDALLVHTFTERPTQAIQNTLRDRLDLLTLLERRSGKPQ